MMTLDGRSLRPFLLAVLLAWVAFGAGSYCAGDPGPPIAIAQRDSLPAAAFAAREAHLRRQLGDSAGVIARLRAQLAGRRVIRPERVIVYDTVIATPDTVYLTVKVGGGGELQADAGVRADSAGQVRPQTLSYDVSRCDDGWALAGDGRVVCDRARLGHLRAWGRIGAAAAVEPQGRPPSIEPRAAAGLRWTPCLRCGLAVELQVGTDGAAALSVERSVRIW